MSYSFNIPNSRPMIQESQSMKNNGGGGNTGYFQRGRKKKEDESTPMFSEKDDVDSFVMETKDEEKTPPKSEKLLKTILNKAKDIIQPPQKPSNNPFASEAEA